MLNYKDKKFSVLGDSVSTLFGYSKPSGAEFYNVYRRYETGVYYMSDTWWGQVIEKLGGQLLVNDSFSGSTVCSRSHEKTEACTCGDKRTSELDEDGKTPDVIIIFMGMNDRGYGVKLCPSCKAEMGDMTVFSQAYHTMLRKIRFNYPDAEIWCLTLPLAEHDGYLPSFAAKTKTGEYSRVITECAEECGCKLVDIHDMEPYKTCDGLHPNAEGMQMLARAVLNAIKNENFNINR